MDSVHDTSTTSSSPSSTFSSIQVRSEHTHTVTLTFHLARSPAGRVSPQPPLCGRVRAPGAALQRLGRLQGVMDHLDSGSGPKEWLEWPLSCSVVEQKAVKDRDIVSRPAGKQESVECNKIGPWRQFSAKLAATLHLLSSNETRFNFLVAALCELTSSCTPIHSRFVRNTTSVISAYSCVHVSQPSFYPQLQVFLLIFFKLQFSHSFLHVFILLAFAPSRTAVSSFLLSRPEELR